MRESVLLPDRSGTEAAAKVSPGSGITLEVFLMGGNRGCCFCATYGQEGAIPARGTAGG